jgi:hypothetical protein
MGAEARAGTQSVTEAGGPPGDDEFELTLLGPGYGESVVMHVGGSEWVIVDSCLDPDGAPGSLRYLEDIGVEPASSVALIVATHWHDDHIRGMARMVELCPDARFCCANILCREEFLTLVGALEGNHFSASGSGLREIHGVFSHLGEKRKVPVHALANRLVFKREGCKIWSLSPGDDVFQRFLRSVGELIPRQGKNKTRIPSLSPNEAAVVLWVDAGEFSLLLGADLERKGWTAILDNAVSPDGRASAFKIPHHGARNADKPAVWERMLEAEPVAVLTPWRVGGHSLPTVRDAKRILVATPSAYITSKGLPGPRSSHQKQAVERTLRDTGAHLRRLGGRRSSVRLRRPRSQSTQWMVEMFGDACHLADYAA